MTHAQSNKIILNNLLDSISNWTRMFLEDSVSIAFDLRTTILDEDMVELRRVRWFTMHAAPELEKLWLRYVDRDVDNDEVKQSLHDFVMLGTSYMFMHNPISEEEYNEFIDHLATSISWPDRATLIPVSLRDYFGKRDAFKSILTTNGWLVFLILLSSSDIK